MLERPVTTSIGCTPTKLKRLENISKAHNLKSRNALIAYVLDVFLKEYNPDTFVIEEEKWLKK